MTPRPLENVRIVDLTNVLAGPYCTYQLALLGAEVIKVELPGQGDLARQLGADEALNRALLGTSFLAQNAGKSSVELDLTTPAGRQQFEHLVKSADVLVENFRPGVLGRLGFSWETLHELNPRLIYCSISGFGQTGPMSNRPAYDQIIQGLSGMMSVTGTADTAPLRVGFPICDTLGGLAAALAITASLVARSTVDGGARIDVSMLEVAVSAMGWVVSNYLIAGVEPQPMANDNATSAPSGTFLTGQGALNIAANRQEQFATLCSLIGRPELLEDPRYAERASRQQHRADLNADINQALQTRSAYEWEKLLSDAGVPAARVLSVPDVVGLEQLEHRRFFTELAIPDVERSFRVSGSGVQFDGETFYPDTPPPKLGEHNAKYLLESSTNE